MYTTSIQTLTFLFDNKTDHLLLYQINADGFLKRKHSGLKGSPAATEDLNEAAIRSVRESCGLELDEAVLRGVVKSIYPDSQLSVIYFVYESSRFSGGLNKTLPGLLKWIDILNIFNLEMESLVREIMPRLLDGESFFEGTLEINDQDELMSSTIRICNSI